jgi:type VI secretion system secreted protein Hcp
MAFEAYLTIEGQKQGPFKGESRREKHKDKLDVLRFELGVNTPKDVKTGQSSGRRSWSPLVVTKEVGVSTPLIAQACATNERMKKVTLEFTRTNVSGEEEIYYTITLENAQVSDIRYSTGGTNLGGDSSARGGGAYDLMEQETISFTFQRISMRHMDGTEVIDDWSIL